MGQLVCRAITLYSYHMPITTSSLNAQYSTIGFFDGMSTKSIEIDYKKEDLKALWQYTTEQTEVCDGSYSFQNIFALADTEWNNNCTDEDFWNLETDKKYPLTLVVCLQLKDYMREPEGIRKQCEEFNSIVATKLSDGLGYAYCSNDKNEFIVCLKCKNYHNAVSTVKALHTIEINAVVYGYTVFSVNHEVLQRLSTEDYPYLYDEEIDSICFKGITNSIKNAGYRLMLDEKYSDFCEKLAKKLYLEEERPESVEIEGADIDTGLYKDRTYDILGDDDFRYIARKVKLGRLLYEYRREGLLSYSNAGFAFYLFSSSLVLNTTTDSEGKSELSMDRVCQEGENQIFANKPENCNEVTVVLEEMKEIILRHYDKEDTVWSVYYALYQLLQSFKVLELSPAKRYDFFSMFPPYKLLVKIVKERLEQRDENTIIDLREVFEFIHKISMTFHSAQRTDIQFFQIQDFNVIVHYAPAKLRAFYAGWISELADLYKQFKEGRQKEYEFIFAPGMFANTSVRQLFSHNKMTKRLMLLTLPDRSVYQVRRLLIVLSHEAAHVGCKRQREERHNYALKACVRVAILELHAFMGWEICNHGEQLKEEVFVRTVREDGELLQEMGQVLEEESEAVLQQFGDAGNWNEARDDECRRRQSTQHMIQAFGEMNKKYGEKIVADYCCQIKNEYIAVAEGKNREDIRKYNACIGTVCDNARKQMPEFIKNFHNIQLKKILDIFYHIEEEAFADLITILTLEHSIEDYIFSFTEDEIAKESLADPKEATAVIVRMALVVEVVGEAVTDEWMCANRPDFAKEWEKGKLKEICINFKKQSIEEEITGKILCYKDALTNYLEHIERYERMYNVEEQGYTDTLYGFFMDQEVWRTLYDYLCISAKAYIETLSNPSNMTIYNKKCWLAKVYKELKAGTVIDWVQIMENFLRDYEQQ